LKIPDRTATTMAAASTITVTTIPTFLRIEGPPKYAVRIPTTKHIVQREGARGAVHLYGPKKVRSLGRSGELLNGSLLSERIWIVTPLPLKTGVPDGNNEPYSSAHDRGHDSPQFVALDPAIPMRSRGLVAISVVYCSPAVGAQAAAEMQDFRHFPRAALWIPCRKRDHGQGLDFSPNRTRRPAETKVEI
jgi:hypothetical protein